MARSGATKQSSWIATPGWAGLGDDKNHCTRFTVIHAPA
jgi:hypothetical protein